METQRIRKVRPIVLSLSPGPAFIGNPKHFRENVSLWRISGDFWDKWPALKHQLELCREWAPIVTEGHWSDADMLPLGKLNIRTELKDGKPRYTNFTKDEQYFLMTLWSIFRSPLMIGGNMPDNDAFTLSLLTNNEMLMVNQKSTNNHEISFKNGLSLWTANDKENQAKYFAFLNVSEMAVELTITPAELGLTEKSVIRDIWKKTDLGAIGKEFTFKIPAHGAILYSSK